MHIVESLVDAGQILAMRDELIDLELAVLIIRNELAHLRATLDTAESAAFPHTACDKLEGCKRC